LQVSVDGFIEGPNGEMDWVMTKDEETWKYALYGKGYASQISSAAEGITGRRRTTFGQFAKDYADAFR
jgi:dihydrofolate reductase